MVRKSASPIDIRKRIFGIAIMFANLLRRLWMIQNVIQELKSSYLQFNQSTLKQELCDRTVHKHSKYQAQLGLSSLESYGLWVLRKTEITIYLF